MSWKDLFDRKRNLKVSDDLDKDNIIEFENEYDLEDNQFEDSSNLGFKDNSGNYLINNPEFSKGQFGKTSDTINQIVHKETEKEYIMEIEIPEVKKEDIYLDVKNKNLILKISKKTEIKKESENQYFHGRSFSGSYHSTPLPENADSQNIQAGIKNGKLEIHIPKLKNKIRVIEED